MNNILASLSTVSVKSVPGLRWTATLVLLSLALLAPTAVYACSLGHGTCGG